MQRGWFAQIADGRPRARRFGQDHGLTTAGYPLHRADKVLADLGIGVRIARKADTGHRLKSVREILDEMTIGDAPLCCPVAEKGAWRPPSRAIESRSTPRRVRVAADPWRRARGNCWRIKARNVPTDENLPLCIACGHCVAVCEPEALRHSAIPGGATPAIDGETLTDEQLERFLRHRRSIRRFKKAPIEPEKLDRLFDLARYAPTGKNRQGVCHTILTGERIRQLEFATAAFYRNLIARVESPIGRRLVRLAAGAKTLEELIWGLPDLKRDVADVDQGKPTYCHDPSVVVVIHGETSSTMHEDCSYAA